MAMKGPVEGPENHGAPGAGAAIAERSLLSASPRVGLLPISEKYPSRNLEHLNFVSLIQYILLSPGSKRPRVIDCEQNRRIALLFLTISAVR